MNKKAQGISMNVIIIAAIALLVLVILSVIFIGRMGSFGRAAANCESQGGQCLPPPCSKPEYGQLTRHPTLSCGEDTENICCLAIG